MKPTTRQIEILINLVDESISNFKSVAERTGKKNWTERVDELNELREKLYDDLILSWYMKGFNDELSGTSSIVSDDEILNKAYSSGASDAIIGDDVMSNDYRSGEDILKQIKGA
jgi:hypothetical protein